MTTSRFLRTPVRTGTVTGTTSVGGAATTVLSINPDGTVSFVDRNGATHRIQCPALYTTDFKNKMQPTTKAFRGDVEIALYALVDALIARQGA